MFLALFPSLFRYTSQERDIEDNIQSIGAIVETLKYAPNCIPDVVKTLLPYLLGTLSSNDEGLIRNAVYGFGVLFDKNGLMMQNKIAPVINYIHSAHSNVKDQAVKDNIIAALCKIIMQDK